MPHQNHKTPLAALLVGERNLDEVGAHGVSSRPGGGLLHNLNLHVSSSVELKALIIPNKIAVLPKVIERHVHQPGADGALLLGVFLAFHSRSPFVPQLVTFQG